MITLNCVIQPDTVRELENVADVAAKLKVDKCNFQLLDMSIDRSGYCLKPSLTHLENNLSRKIPGIAVTRLAENIRKAETILKRAAIPLSFTPDFSRQQIFNYYQTFPRYKLLLPPSAAFSWIDTVKVVKPLIFM